MKAWGTTVGRVGAKRWSQRKSEHVDDRWWLIGWNGVVGEPEEWPELDDPETDEGQLRKSP
jgi:hypothetical protein